MKIEIFPLEKVVLDGVSICFGMPKNEVEALLGKAIFSGERDYYYQSELAISYDAENNVNFIEFLGGCQGNLRPVIFGVSAFDISADELTAILTQRNNGDIGDWENGYSYAFLNISVGVYREMLPSDVEEMIAEMKANGIPTENNADLEADKQKAAHWATVGVGIAGYYRR